MIVKHFAVIVGFLTAVHRQCTAQNLSSSSSYEVIVDGIIVNDVATGIKNIATIHNDRPIDVVATLVWATDFYDVSSSNEISWELYVNDVVEGSGVLPLVEHYSLPATLAAGSITLQSTGTFIIKIAIKLDTVTSENSREYQCFTAAASLWPLVIIVFIASTTGMVELSLGLGIFTGSCMVSGSLAAGYRNMLGIYLLNSLADQDHGYVFLFALFMAGLVGLIEKSGGLSGITHVMQSFVTTSRSAQGASFLAGIIIFFDDYTTCLVAGASMRPLTDVCVVSREKLAFIVDATAAPIASIVPISSWIGYEIGLIQTELDAILAKYPDSVIGNTSSFNAFLTSVKYRYYCIFMLLLIPLQILSGRDFGPMLVAERLTKVYGRTDGGPGKAVSFDGSALISPNAPKPDTPHKWWNMVVPVVALILYIFSLLVWTGRQAAVGEETIYEIIGMGNSYDALLWGTMATVLTSVGFYFVQDITDGRIIWFNLKGYASKLRRFVSRTRGTAVDDDKVHAKMLIDTREAMYSFFSGMERIFGILIILTLAWATGSIMGAVGLNRWCGEIITDPDLDTRLLPTVTFIIACFIGLATGTSWGTMAILFPLLLVPTYEATNGDPTIFYGVVAGILAGAVAGDHSSPISDTTILSALASECQVLAHAKTQAPYALIVVVWSVLVGTLPLGMGTFPNGVSIFLGFVAMLFHVVFTSEFIINKTGRFDVFTEIYIRCIRDKEFYTKLKGDVVKAFESGMPVELPEGKVIRVSDGQSEINVHQSEDTGLIDKLEQEMVTVVDVGYEDPVVQSGGDRGTSSHNGYRHSAL